ncbi:hypothetical protein GGI12_000425 [Dipsacomyces acuminosporus]|nr:hypothetical protein GGI12_000425 [Dipsacomyces acuminosporus]
MNTSDATSEHTLNEGTRGRDCMELYRTLGVEQDATQQELKRAYRRLALRYHPDRNPDTASEFVRIQNAYDILSDERMRRIYDRYGEIGIQMAGRVGGEILDPQVSSLLSGFAFASSLVALLLIAFLALLARRVDKAISWPFAVVFTPLWTIDLCLIAGMVWAFFRQAAPQPMQDSAAYDEDGGAGTTNNSNFYGGDAASDSEQSGTSRSSSFSADALGSDGERHSSTGAADGTIFSTHGPNTGYSSTAAQAASQDLPAASDPATDSTPLLGSRQNDHHSYRHSHHRRQRRAKRRQLRKIRKLAEHTFASLAKITPAIYIVLLVSFQLSIVLRIDGHVSWPAWLVAVPWFSIELIHLLLSTLQLVAALLKIGEKAERHQDQPRLTIKLALAVALDNYWWLLIRVSQAALIVLKLDSYISASWMLVFVPTYLPAIRSAVALCFLRNQLRAMDDAEIMQNENAIILSFGVLFVVVSSFVYSFVALLIWKLSLPSAVRLALVFIPVFIALSLTCCCCSLVSCCLANGMIAQVGDEESQEATDTIPVSSDRRLH